MSSGTIGKANSDWKEKKMSNDTGLPLITVVGASGKQGRSVVDSLARRRHYRVRA